MTGDIDNSAYGDRITAAGRKFLVIWTAGLLLLLVIFGWLTVGAQRRNRLASVERQQAVMDPLAAEKGVTPPDLTLPPGANPAQVHVGLYVDRIAELSVKDASWTVDFYVWFRVRHRQRPRGRHDPCHRHSIHRVAAPVRASWCRSPLTTIRPAFLRGPVDWLRHPEPRPPYGRQLRRLAFA